MLVYRIEHKDFQHGPYQASENVPSNHENADELCGLSREIADSHCGDSDYEYINGGRIRKHPVIYFIVDWNSKRHRCGCLSYTSLKQWFKGWGKRLREYNYVVRVFSVPKAKVQIPYDRKQVAFEFAHAKLLKEYPVPKTI